MGQPAIKVLGAYKLEPTAKLFKSAMEMKYGGIRLSKNEKKEAEEAVREEISSVVLSDFLRSCRMRL